MSVKEGIEYFIKPSLENIKVLFLGEPLQLIHELMPNAVIYYYNHDKTVNFPVDYFDIIIDHDYLIYIDDLRVFEPIYKLLKFDGMLLGIGYDKENNDISKAYMFLARYSLFDDITIWKEIQEFVIKIRKFKNTTIELKRQYTENIRRKLARLLHRLEADLYVENNTLDLAILCESNGIDEIYLNNFINNTIIYKDRVINNICGNSIVNEIKNNRVRNVLGNNQYDFQHKIAFIMCVNNDELYNEALLYLSDLIVPVGYGIEIIDVRNANSMCNGYNRALKITDAKYKVYIHQDTFIYNKNFISDILHIFKNKKIGCIGLAGCAKLTESGIWWRGDTNCGKVIMEKEFEEYNAFEYGSVKGLYQEAEALDGVLLVTQYDVEWREDLFTGWHFYDVSMCMEMRKRGYDTVVVNQGDDYWALHCPGNKMLDLDYEKYRNIFLNEYFTNK